MAKQHTIIGIGEALYDQFPDASHLGGAPLNVVGHAGQLGNEAVLISRVGQDRLGTQLLDELKGRGLKIDLIQTDPDFPTGTVIVELDAEGEPRYEIVKNVAYDWLQFDYDLEDVARDCDAICFGTLAQRNAQARNTIYRFLELARAAVKLYDVNLRPGLDDRQKIMRGMELADAVKMNADEFKRVARMFLPGKVAGDADAEDLAAGLRAKFDLRFIAVTHGPDGCLIYDESGAYGGPAHAAMPGGDAVGAGDATSAAILHGVVRRWPWSRTLALANRLSAFVAGERGAVPELPGDIRELAGEGEGLDDD